MILRLGTETLLEEWTNLIEFERQNLITGLAYFNEICQRSCIGWGLKSSTLEGPSDKCI